MTAPALPVEAVADLPAAVPLGPAFLGLTRAATIGEVAVDVFIPSFSFDKATGRFAAKLHSRTRARWIDYYSRLPDGDSSPFGRVTSWNPLSGEVNEFTALRLQLFSKETATESEAQNLLHALDAWVESLDRWIEVFGRTDLHTGGFVIHQRHGESGYVWLDEGDGNQGKMVTPRHGGVATITDVNPLEITPTIWAKLLAKASSGNQPPEAHLFLRDARRSMHEGRYRRSVLDAATATEVALTKLRDDVLANVDPNLNKYVRGKAQQISGLVAFLGGMGQPLPSSIQQRIGEPRNRAIHEGKEPVQPTAELALEKAEEVVGVASPWETLLAD